MNIIAFIVLFYLPPTIPPLRTTPKVFGFARIKGVGGGGICSQLHALPRGYADGKQNTLAKYIRIAL